MGLDILTLYQKEPLLIRREGKQFTPHLIYFDTPWILTSNTFGITHNLTTMATKAGLYEALWRPYRLKPEYVPSNYEEEVKFEQDQIIYARELVPALEMGLKRLLESPEKFKKYNAPNGWGTYENLVTLTTNYLRFCTTHPMYRIYISR